MARKTKAQREAETAAQDKAMRDSWAELRASWAERLLLNVLTAQSMPYQFDVAPVADADGKFVSVKFEATPNWEEVLSYDESEVLLNLPEEQDWSVFYAMEFFEEAVREYRAVENLKAANERARATALAKLTPEERTLLGFKSVDR